MNRRNTLPGAALLIGLFLSGFGKPAELKAEQVSSQESQPALSPSLTVKEYELQNGLRVVLSEDHALPSFAAHLVYLVGSGHEEKGKTGFAHLFEHLMFQGSKNFDHEYFAPFEPIGARTNGTTSSDRTVYYEQVPSQYSELTLWMESDRMRSLLPVLTQEKLDNQRDVVKNERRQRYEVTPYGLSWAYLDEAVYPVGHPYHHSTIGSHEDLTAATLDDVRGFFNKYYVPSNAALVLVGDFEENEIREKVEKYFGDIPAGQRAPAPTPERPVIKTPKHWVAEDDIQLSRVYFAWVSPALFEPGDAELDLMSNILAQGKSSRLFHSLVYEKKLAKDIAAYQVSQKLNGMYVIQATCAPGTGLDELAKAVETEVNKALAIQATSAELTRARNDYKKSYFQRLETYASRASLLGAYFLHTGGSDYIEEDYSRYVRTTPQGIQEAAQKYIDFDHVVRLDFIPGKKSTPLVKHEQSEANKADSSTKKSQK